MQALSAALERALMRDVERRGIRPAITSDPPVSLADLRALPVRDLARGRIPVGGAFSDRTIWSSPSVNAAFRAWHDLAHLQLGADFDGPGEYRVAAASLDLAVSPRDRAILWAESWGQVSFFLRHNAFPENQRAFVDRLTKHLCSTCPFDS